MFSVYIYLSCVFCVVLSLVLFVIVSCHFPRIPGLFPESGELSTLTSQVSGSVSPYLAARLVRLLRFTSSYRAPDSCLILPLELPPPGSSPLPPGTGSVVIPPARIVLCALPLCLDRFTPHFPCCFKSVLSINYHFLQTPDKVFNLDT